MKKKNDKHNINRVITPPIENTPFKELLGRILREIFPDKYHSRGLYAGMEYVVRKLLGIKGYRQEDAANEWQVTTVTVRSNYSSIKNIITEKELLEIYNDNVQL